MEVSVAERARVEDILQELQGNEAVCGKVGVLQYDTAGLRINVQDTSDFDGDLPDVLESVVTRLQVQAAQEGDEVAREAMVLLHQTLRRIDHGACGRRRAAMKLVSVKVENFRCIRAAKIDFTDG